MDSICFVGSLILVFVVYKLLDRLVRWPTVGKYNDRHILVTGCDSGFGYTIARRLDEMGCHVFAACLTEVGKLELARTCSDRMNAFEMDVTNHDSVLRAYEYVTSILPVGKGTGTYSDCSSDFLLSKRNFWFCKSLYGHRVGL